MYIKIVTIGKINHGPFKILLDEYLKRLSAWKVEVVELKDEAAVSKYLGKVGIDYKPILLDDKGELMNSKGFADFILGAKDKGDKLCFVIGGPFGFSEPFKIMIKLKTSLGPMTFTHEFARVLLLEQIYRAWTLDVGKKYDY